MGIRLDDISFAYGCHQVVCGANLHLPAGKFGAILGRNGSGKSTLLRIAAGLQLAQQGSVAIADQELKQLNVR